MRAAVRFDEIVRKHKHETTSSRENTNKDKEFIERASGRENTQNSEHSGECEPPVG